MGLKLNSLGFETILPQNIDSKEMVLDLRNISWVYPDGATAFYLLLKYRSLRNAKTKVLLPLNEDITSYLERMNCFGDLGDCVIFEPDISPFLTHAWHDSNTMHQLIQVTNKDQVPLLVNKFVRNLEEQREVTNEEKKNITSCMVELFQNMPDHANPTNPDVFTGYVGLQSYEKRDRIYLAIGDLGVGIRNSLMTRDLYKGFRWKDEDAIKAVMTERMSRHTDLDHTRGGGVRRAVENVAELRGYILIRSRQGAVYRGPNGGLESFRGLKLFPGTQIVIITTKFGRRR